MENGAKLGSGGGEGASSSSGGLGFGAGVKGFEAAPFIRPVGPPWRGGHAEGRARQRGALELERVPVGNGEEGGPDRRAPRVSERVKEKRCAGFLVGRAEEMGCGKKIGERGWAGGKKERRKRGCWAEKRFWAEGKNVETDY